MTSEIDAPESVLPYGRLAEHRRCDMAYHDSQYFQDAENSKNSLMLTPVKAVKGQDADLKQKDKAANVQMCKYENAEMRWGEGEVHKINA